MKMASSGEQGVPANGNGLISHPLRQRIIDEIHARPFAPLPIPCRVAHFAFLTDPAAAAADRAALDRLRRHHGLSPLAGDARHSRLALDGLSLRWESHGEFTTYSWEWASRTGSGDPFAVPLPAWPDWHAQPGPLIAAADLHLVDGTYFDDAVRRLFSEPGCAVSEVRNGDAVIASDFGSGHQGLVRIAVFARTLSPEQAGPLVQRLLEIDTYRSLSLLGLPEAQRLSPLLHALEIELPPLIAHIRSSAGLAANRALLDKLSEMATQLEAERAATAFRFGATRAYFELVQLRLEAIDETPIPGGRRWAAFLNHRLSPAMRTCRAIEARQADLSRKLTRATQLLRTQVEVDLAHQNHHLLKVMGDRVRLQTRLQQTVEGLSVVAITYYAASLVHLLMEGADKLLGDVSPDTGAALAVPLIALIVATQVRRVRARHQMINQAD